MKIKEKIIVMVVGIITGIVLSLTSSYAIASTLINSKDVVYEDNSGLGVNNVQAAIDGTCTKFSNQLTSLQTTILNKVYPVGSIYISTSNTNPGTLFGGTWVTWGSGRVPVGVNTSDTDFNTVEKTGGVKEHRHLGDSIYTVIDGKAYVGITNDKGGKVTQKDTFYGSEVVKIAIPDLPDSTNFEHIMEYYTSYEKNLPPYITCYMWKRTK